MWAFSYSSTALAVLVNTDVFTPALADGLLLTTPERSSRWESEAAPALNGPRAPAFPAAAGWRR
jgi:hypothetical protein